MSLHDKNGKVLEPGQRILFHYGPKGPALGRVRSARGTKRVQIVTDNYRFPRIVKPEKLEIVPEDYPSARG